MCKKKLRGLEKECPNCRTDVSLLVHYVEDLRDGVARAEALTRDGQLGEAVWAYLAVLEVDPDNATARRQVGKVATAVRQFDQTAPGRRWMTKLRKQTRFRRWMAGWSQEGDSTSLLSGVLWFLLIFGALMIGYFIGLRSVTPLSDNPPSETKKVEKTEKDKKGDAAGKEAEEK
jgi:hypothetical protein